VISNDYHLNYIVFNFSNLEYQNELEWVNDKEFIYQSFMYDVISISISKEIVQIKCIKDKFESLFKDYFSKYVSNQRPNKSKNLSFSLSELLKFKYIQFKKINLLNSFFEIEHLSYSVFKLNKIFINIPSPPP